MIEGLQARAIHLLWRLLSHCRLKTMWSLAGVAARVLYAVSRRERHVSRRNLEVAYPGDNGEQRRSRIQASLRHSAATMLELGFAWIAAPRRVDASIVEVHGRELLDEARAEDRGVIVLAPHFGNWEVLNFWLSSHFPFTAMYEPPKMADLDPVIRHGRERMGAELVPTNPRGVAALLKALKRAEAVGILPDQEPDWGSGVFADFFGRPAYTATLLPKLVARTQARVVTGVARRLPEGRGFAIHFLAADERVYDTDEKVSALGVNACVESAIALDPVQYQWEYKRWKKTEQEQQLVPGYRKHRLYSKR
ncbi:lysophospholipid acyltransferase family protein [Salinicola acroporae]|uniref:Lipid A biosynthesis acyltransferase n=1 Tax=Salinicola acroporae TaxID=1541440 RepID=A0ABT6I3M5_9GAMM|nr:lipid A biosynthesis acyltransferase [Salinicola acroporae]MDH4572289.1 lipid A biosynthesis acyltransferase [Salinicola acroporae]